MLPTSRVGHREAMANLATTRRCHHVEGLRIKISRFDPINNWQLANIMKILDHKNLKI
jgi:hypothetical protein